MVSLLSEFRATLPFLQLRSGERDQSIINEVGAALLPRSGLVPERKAAPRLVMRSKSEMQTIIRVQAELFVVIHTLGIYGYSMLKPVKKWMNLF